MKKHLSILASLLFLFAVTGTLQAQTNVPAIIDSSQVWDISGSPYYITQNTYIDTNASVKVMPGVEIQSTGGTYELIIDGEFRAEGTIDSMILIESLTLDFNRISASYDSAAGTGSYFNYCQIKGPGSSKRAIQCYNGGIRVENCEFSNCFYGIYTSSSGSSSVLDVFNCTFTLASGGFGYHLYGASSYGTMNVSGCTFFGGYGIYGYGKVNWTDNIFDDMSRIYLYSYRGLNLNCNEFRNIRYGLNISANHYQDTSATVNVTHNTFDTLGYNNDAMLKINVEDHMHFNYNNFLYYAGSVDKVLITGSNPSPSTYISVDFTSNYWGTTDSATIESHIKDYKDDIQIIGRADISNYLSSEDTSCTSSNPSSCQASFYAAVDTSQSYTLYIINNSKGLTSGTSYYWTFGDGSSSTAKNPTHQYNSFGKYELCLTILDSSANCYSTYCDSIGMDSSGSLLKQEGFKLVVLDEGQILSTEKPEPITGLSVYPNPGSGLFVAELPGINGKYLDVRVMDLTGRMVVSKQMTPIDGDKKLSLDLTELQEGMYLLQMDVEGQQLTTRVIINR